MNEFISPDFFVAVTYGVLFFGILYVMGIVYQLVSSLLDSLINKVRDHERDS